MADARSQDIVQPSHETASDTREVSFIDEIPKQSELSHLKLAPFQFKERVKCPQCQRSSLMYCSNCLKPLPSVPIPHLTLPIPLHIVHHPKEKKSKSTAMHALILAPESTTIHEFPNFPDFNPKETLCLFPAEDAKLLEDFDVSPFKQVVFIDSTWSQAKQICRDARIQSLTKVRIHDQKTLFWRTQTEAPEFLATIEAIYYFFKEYFEASHKQPYNGEFDNLMFFYAFNYEHIQDLFAKSKDRLVSRKISDSYLRERREHHPDPSQPKSRDRDHSPDGHDD
ncbi:putative DTW domain protein [Blattamonas nauphoetae]|uniref:tRNA-uridine aminocarboxypropyltransferase 1 n=1 Tax=Blattamonas nauphoetae TaxID=2049346 RepID=A0ABQ9X9T1_9EUKA|nr:putative DTW domain protein [Blattamonas nauphoetae]